jgi:glycosyltransferase involved in cell wall biosynthesis
MPVRNNEKTVLKAVCSMAYQTHKNRVIIAIDDQSTDGSLNILKTCWDAVSYQGKCHTGQPILVDTWKGERDQFNMSNVLNMGISIAVKMGAEYIARMDGDDWSDIYRIEAQLDHMQANSLDLCGTFSHIVDNQEKLIEDFHPRIPTGDERTWLTKFNYLVHGSVLMKTDVLRNVGLYSTNCCYIEDYDLWLRAADRFKIGVVPYYLYTLRRGPSSTAGKGNEIYNRAKQLREAWATKWGIQIPDYDLPNYCTIPDSKI